MANWNRERVEHYAGQILTALINNPMASEELVAVGLSSRSDEGEDSTTNVHEWAEHWADIAFDVAEVFAAEAAQRDADPACRLLEAD